MCQLLETIRLEDGVLQQLSYHQARMKAAQKALFPGKTFSITPSLVKNAPTTGLFKCRIIYDKQIRQVEYLPYHIPQIRSLKMVSDDSIDYSHKYVDRTPLNQLFQQRANADDILIVKNGLVSDTSFCNILFYNNKQWLTPSLPLLKGTQRQYLLEKEIIQTADIRPQDIQHFSKIRLVNAMIRFEDKLDLIPSSIF